MRSPILIVDDDPIVSQMLRSSLEQSGFEVECASNGREALENMGHSGSRLVISDWQMPEMDGLKLCQHIRSGDFGGYIYFILLTSMNSIDERIRGLAAGADDFVSKPFHPTELVARVNVGRRVLQLETREALIFSLAKLAESRDPETGHHLERVQCYSRCLAERLAEHPRYGETITPQYIHLIYQTSPLHDIGKVGIPDQVLLKPGRLTAEEFETIKRHPLIGARTLHGAIERSPEAAFLRMAYDITLSHHEKYDGNGYPNGLKGEAIPLSARIVALADVYDALTTSRVYKNAYSRERSEAIIAEGRGSHFDPDVVDAFWANRDAFHTIRTRLNDSVSNSGQSVTTPELEAKPAELLEH